MARRQVEGGYQPPKRMRRGGIIALSIVGSVVLVTAAAIFGALMYGWTHQPIYQHKDDVYAYVGEDVDFSTSSYTQAPNADNSDVVRGKTEHDKFTINDTEDLALFTARIEADTSLEDPDQDIVDTYDAYKLALATYDYLDNSKISFVEPAFLKTTTTYNLDKGEKNLITGDFDGQHGNIEVLTSEYKDQQLLKARQNKLTRGQLYVQYKDNDSIQNWQFVYRVQKLTYTYEVISSYYNTVLHKTYDYVSYSMTYEISFHGYFDLVVAPAK